MKLVKSSKDANKIKALNWKSYMFTAFYIPVTKKWNFEKYAYFIKILKQKRFTPEDGIKL